MKELTISCLVMITTLASDSVGRGSTNSKVDQAYIMIESSVRAKMIYDREQINSTLQDAKMLNNDIDSLGRELDRLKKAL